MMLDRMQVAKCSRMMVGIVLTLLLERHAGAGTLTTELDQMTNPATCTGACATTRVPVIMCMGSQLDARIVVDGLQTQAERVPVLVGALKNHAAATQNAPSGTSPGLLDHLATLSPSDVANVRPLWIANCIYMEAIPSVVRTCATRPDLTLTEYASRRAISPVSASPSGLPTRPTWNQTAINAAALWGDGITGAGVKIGILSTGVDGAHPELVGSRLLKPDGCGGQVPVWKDLVGNATSPVDTHGEGTFTAALAAGDNVGMAPDARWLACRGVDIGADGTVVVEPARIAECLQFLIDPDGNGSPTNAANVIVYSQWAAPGLCAGNPSLHQALQAVRASGVLLVVPSGHERDHPSASAPTGVLPQLANYPGALSVGGASLNAGVWQLRSQSYRGTAACSDFSAASPPARAAPQVIAPSNAVISALPGGGYGTLQRADPDSPGTMVDANPEATAAAHVAGAAALLLSMLPADSGVADVLDNVLSRHRGGTGPAFIDLLLARSFDDARVPVDATGAVLGLAPPQSTASRSTQPATVTLRNWGWRTWLPTTHRLKHAGAVGPSEAGCGGTQTWGIVNPPLAPGAQVLPGGQAAFNFTVTIPYPNPAAPYRFAWQLERFSGAASLGDVGTPTPDRLVSVPRVPTDSSTGFFWIDPANFLYGVTSQLTVIFTNPGPNAWLPGEYAIAELDGRGWIAPSALTLSTAVCPNASKSTGPCDVVVPSVAGSYPFKFQMQKNGVGFGTLLDRTNVVPAVNSAIFRGWQYALPEYLETELFWIFPRFENSGTTTWGSTHCLVPVPGMAWVVPDAPQCRGGSPVSPGTTVTIPVRVSTTSGPVGGIDSNLRRPGRFPVSFQMASSGSRFGQTTDGTASWMKVHWYTNAVNWLKAGVGTIGAANGGQLTWTNGPNYWFFRGYNGSGGWRAMEHPNPIYGAAYYWYNAERPAQEIYTYAGGETFIHPGGYNSEVSTGYASAFFFHSPVATSVTLSGGIYDSETGGGDGVSLRLKKNNVDLVSDQALPNGFGLHTFSINTSVAVNDTLRVIVHPRSGGNGHDRTGVSWVSVTADIPDTTVGDIVRSSIIVPELIDP